MSRSIDAARVPTIGAPWRELACALRHGEERSGADDFERLLRQKAAVAEADRRCDQVRSERDNGAEREDAAKAADVESDDDMRALLPAATVPGPLGPLWDTSPAAAPLPTPSDSLPGLALPLAPSHTLSAPALVTPPQSAADAAVAGTGSASAAKMNRMAAAQADAAVAPLDAARNESGGAWALSLHDPRGLAVELQAARPTGQRPSAGAAGWTLTLGSPVLDARALMQHVPRLSERLKAQGLTRHAVRIENEGKPS
jgi:hypothetical protein